MGWEETPSLAAHEEGSILHRTEAGLPQVSDDGIEQPRGTCSVQIVRSVGYAFGWYKKSTLQDSEECTELVTVLSAGLDLILIYTEAE